MNLDYKKVLVDKDDLKKHCGSQAVTYPQIKLDDKYIGDYFAFQDYIEESEPMLLPTMKRFTIFPIEHENLWILYKKAQMSNWTAEEIDTSADMDDWKSLSDNERHFIKYILAFFAGSDGIVFENINNNFADEVQYTEARSFYAYQVHNEMVHGETYSKLIDKYIRDDHEKRNLLDAITTIKSIKQKADWALKWFDKSRPFSERLLAFACVEGIFFSGSFCAIFWLKKRGLMPGLCFSNELISRDEGLHLQFALELFQMLKNKPSEDTVHDIVKESVEIEKSFIIDSLPCKLIGMNADRMSEYIEYVADRLLKQAGFNKIWNTQNPFDFMENISLDGKTNFFEKRVGDYGKIQETTDVTFDDEF
tara:strand:- start:425 stop:1516 length:1092 start_codon:yes stop_codon:yes gene_type:complete